jgi:hypothetical protein
VIRLQLKPKWLPWQLREKPNNVAALDTIANRKSWIIRAFIAPVVFFNLQCSFAFLFNPEGYTPSFNLYEQTGAYLIQGLGLLFLMWNIPYLVALLDPIRHSTSLLEAVIMQAIGVIGESLLLLSVPQEYLNLHASVLRFIIFDGGGLVFLLIALFIRKRIK